MDLDCPSCEGQRTVFAHINYGGMRPGEFKHINCPTCGGQGKITPEHMARIVEGRRIRDERIARDESLREAARRLGMKASAYSDLERGRGVSGG